MPSLLFGFVRRAGSAQLEGDCLSKSPGGDQLVREVRKQEPSGPSPRKRKRKATTKARTDARLAPLGVVLWFPCHYSVMYAHAYTISQSTCTFIVGGGLGIPAAATAAAASLAWAAVTKDQKLNKKGSSRSVSPSITPSSQSKRQQKWLRGW